MLLWLGIERIQSWLKVGLRSVEGRLGATDASAPHLGWCQEGEESIRDRFNAYHVRLLEPDGPSHRRLFLPVGGLGAFLHMAAHTDFFILQQKSLLHGVQNYSGCHSATPVDDAALPSITNGYDGVPVQCMLPKNPCTSSS